MEPRRRPKEVECVGTLEVPIDEVPRSGFFSKAITVALHARQSRWKTKNGVQARCSLLFPRRENLRGVGGVGRRRPPGGANWEVVADFSLRLWCSNDGAMSN